MAETRGLSATLRKHGKRPIGALAVRALPAIYGAVLVLFVIRILPPGEYGRYGIAWAFVNIVIAVWRGTWMSPLLTWASRGKSELMLAPSTWLSLGTALLGGLVGILFLSRVGADGALPVLAALTLLAFIPRDLATNLAQSQIRVGVSLLMDGAFYLGSAGGFLFLAWRHQLLTGEDALTVNLVSILASTVLGLIFYPRLLHPGLRGNWREIVRFGRWSGIQGFADIWVQQGDAILGGIFLNPVILAPYLAARAIMRLYTLISQSVNFILLPVAARLSAAGDMAKLAQRLGLAIGLTWILLVPVNVVAWWACEALFPAFLGAKYTTAIPFFRIIILISFLEPVFSMITQALVGMALPKRAAMLTIIGGAFALAANVILLPTIGLFALPWVLVATYLILASLSLRVAAREIGRVDPLPNVWRASRVLFS